MTILADSYEASTITPADIGSKVWVMRNRVSKPATLLSTIVWTNPFGEYAWVAVEGEHYPATVMQQDIVGVIKKDD